MKGALTKPSTTNERQSLHWTFWFGVSFFVLVIVSILGSAYVLLHRLQQDEAAPLTHIVIDGHNPYTQRAEVLKAIDAVNLNNFFNVDVNQVQQHLATLPWVYSVSVRKQWPNELKIYLVDQTPVAIWNGDFILNQYGQTFQADQQKLKSPLPQLFGPGGSEQLALKNYQQMDKLLSYGQLSISELILSERFAWQLTLTNGVILNLGREDRFARVQRFLDVFQEIKKTEPANQTIDTIDLRYDTGLAVAWKPINNKQRV